MIGSKFKQMKKVDEILVKLPKKNSKIKNTLRVVCAADTHGMFSKMIERSCIPSGDIFIHAGDFTLCALKSEVEEFNKCIELIPHKYKIVICGNRDKFDHLSPDEIQKMLPNCIYLQDNSVIIEGITIHGSPWDFLYEGAFYTKNPEKLWSKIPENVDILVTHIPPINILDLARDFNVNTDKLCKICDKIHKGFNHWGNKELKNEVIDRIKPKGKN